MITGRFERRLIHPAGWIAQEVVFYETECYSGIQMREQDEDKIAET